MPFFAAISYVWGSPEKSHMISCNEMRMAITENLRVALLQVRHSTEPLTLWADGICINQDDNVEKGHQVALMGALYARADRVLVCLGSDPDYEEEAEAVSGLVSDVSAMVLRTLENIEITWDTFPFPDPDDPLLTDERWHAMRVLFDQPWFERGWVVQEVWLGRSPRLLWSGRDIGWLEIVRSYLWMNTRAAEIYARHALTLLTMHRTQYGLRYPKEAMPLLPEKPSEWFPGVMDVARPLKLTDQRDRIYAFMSLAAPGHMPSTLQPDYTKAYLDVYCDFATEYINSRKDLGILYLVDHDETTFSNDYPTWVPRWDRRVALENLPPFSHQIPGPVLARAHGGVLRVRGIVVGSIKFVSSEIDWVKTGLSNIVAIMRDLANTGIRPPYLDEVMPAVLAFACALVGGLQPASRKVWKSDRAAYILRLIEADTPRKSSVANRFKNEAEEGDTPMFHSWVRAYGHTRRVIQTDRGHFGIAPGIVEEGDLCCAIAGAWTLLVIRKSQDGRWKLVGPAYIASDKGTIQSEPIGCGDKRNLDWQEWGPVQEISIC